MYIKTGIISVKFNSVFLPSPGNGADYKEWAMIELQGALESRTKESMHAKFIGDLHFSPDVRSLKK